MNHSSLKVYGIVEGFEPITLKTYREYWSNMTGLSYQKDFYIVVNDVILTDDSYLIAGDIS
jgi:hypothetical protein